MRTLKLKPLPIRSIVMEGVCHIEENIWFINFFDHDMYSVMHAHSDVGNGVYD